MHMAKVLWICITVFDKSKMSANFHTLCVFCGWPLVWGKRSDRMLTRGPDVAFQKNTFLSLASVCLSCQDPLFCFQLSLTAPLLPLPHLKWPPQWLALVLEQKEGKALRIYVWFHNKLEKMCQMQSTAICQLLSISKLFLQGILSKKLSSLHLYKCGLGLWKNR